LATGAPGPPVVAPKTGPPARRGAIDESSDATSGRGVLANALEDNFRLYSYDRGRRQLASVPVKAPPMGQWHLLRVDAIGDHIQGWLDGALLLDHRDARFRTGRQPRHTDPALRLTS
jgi:hypothetical protein